MKQDAKHSGRNAPPRPKNLRRMYILTLVVLAFTGFGQMPIFKRYGISSIPGMAWSADYYATHYVHYLGAILLIALLAYGIVYYLGQGRKAFQLTGAAFVQMLLMVGIVATGILRVIKNLPDIVFSPGFTMFIDIGHLGFIMLYLILAAVFLATRTRWLAPRRA